MFLKFSCLMECHIQVQLQAVLLFKKTSWHPDYKCGVLWFYFFPLRLISYHPNIQQISCRNRDCCFVLIFLALRLRDSECFGRLSYGRWLTVLLIYRKAVTVEWMLKLKVLQTLWFILSFASSECNSREVLRIVFKEKFHHCLWEIMNWATVYELLVWILHAAKRELVLIAASSQGWGDFWVHMVIVTN